jgi:hypothetical protein
MALPQAYIYPNTRNPGARWGPHKCLLHPVRVQQEWNRSNSGNETVSSDRCVESDSWSIIAPEHTFAYPKRSVPEGIKDADYI